MSISASITSSIGQSISNSIGSGPRAIFESELQSSLIPQIANGDSTPTFTRATTATVKDFEGLVKTALANEARFKGAREVKNLIVGSSEDMTNAAYVAASGASVTATQVTYNGTANGIVQQVITIADTGPGRTFVYRVDIALISGDPGSDDFFLHRFDIPV